MNKIEIFKKTAITTFSKTKFMSKKYSPEILIGTGIVSIVAGTVMACKATLQVEEVLDEKEVMKETIQETFDNKSLDYDVKSYNKDLVVLNLQTGMKLTKLYIPAVALGVIGISAILGSHNIMKKRNVAITMAYKAVEKGFNDYRGRVVEDLGKAKDLEYRHGLKEIEVEEEVTDDKGKTKKVKKKVQTIEGRDVSIYSRHFNNSNINWASPNDYNRLFLTNQQNYANDILKARGHIFLNEVYDMLGFERTKEGSVVGWVMDNGDDYVDFGMLDLWNNGYLLDFNVDGVIYDLL